MNLRTTKCLLYFLVVQLAGCGGSQTAEQVDPPVKTAKRVTVTATSPRGYTWIATRTGPGCMPRLRAMMDWYGTQADDIRQIEFTPGVSTDGPLSQGPYHVNMEAVKYYINTLRKSGYFAAQYLDTMQAEAVREQINLQQYQPSKDTAAAIEGFPIFSVNYEDMMDMKNDFLFTAEQNGQAVILDDGYFLRKFLFNQDCKIVRVIPVAKSPRLK